MLQREKKMRKLFLEKKKQKLHPMKRENQN